MQLCFVSVHGPRETYFVDEPRILTLDAMFLFVVQLVGEPPGFF
jgi:hypothetical protein